MALAAAGVMMSRFPPRNRSCRRSRAACALLLATSFAALVPGPLHAQETGLRGDVSESAVLQDQQKEGQWADVPANAADKPALSPFQPLGMDAPPDNADKTGSVGNTPPDAAADDPLADTATPDDPFADDTAPPPLPAKAATRKSLANRSAADETGSDDPGEDKADNDKPAATQASKTGSVPDEENDSQAIANRRAATVDSQDRAPLDQGAERETAIERLNKRPDDDPFAPLGVRVGSFVLRPSIEQGVTASSNADSSAGGRPGVLSETTLRFSAASDWVQNSAIIDGYGIFRKTISGDEISDARGRLEGTFDFDLDREMHAIAKLGYEAGPESASSPVVIEGIVSQPLRQTIDASLGIEKDVGKMRFGLTGAVEHDAYGDADLSSGGTLSQKDRNSTLYTATLRGGYAISPALTPFAEVEVGRRVYDQRIDDGGFERSSSRLGARAGLQLDLGEKLAGEFSAGWIREAIDDDRLGAITAPTLSADLKWSPQRGMIVGLRGTTTLEDTTAAGESGSVLYSGRLTGERRIRADLTVNAALGLDWRDYMGSDGHDLVFSAEAGLTWWLNRYAGLTTRLRHEALASNLPDRSYHANSIFVGLTLQR